MNQKEFYIELNKFKNGIPEPLHETVAVLSYEVGRMMEQAMYMKWNSDDLAEVLTRRGFLKSELMDVLAQCALICEATHTTIEEMLELGMEKACERFHKVERK